MSRPRCDPFDVKAIRAAVEQGETTERAAYLAYAASAARPYARSTFTLILKRGAPLKAEKPTCAAVFERWRERAAVKPRILALSPGGGLRVQAGALIAFDGAQSLKYTKAAKPPLAIVLSSAGGFVSIEAVRFCASARVAIVALNRAHGFLTVMTGAPKANATLIRAQATADPLHLARAIVGAKFDAMRRAGAIERIEPFAGALASAATLDRTRMIEAQASRVAWSHTPALKWSRGPIPSDYAAQWLMRSRLDAKGKRRARHPVNAMLNAAFSVTAGRLSAYLMAAGFAPAIGFLHSDKRGRWSLAWDTIEPLRPMIEARLFAFIARERFAVSDFVRAPDGSIRLGPALLSAVLDECAPSHAALAAAVRWIERLVLSADKGHEAEDCVGKMERRGLAVGGGGLKRGDPAILRIGSRGERGEHGGRVLLKPCELRDGRKVGRRGIAGSLRNKPASGLPADDEH